MKNFLRLIFITCLASQTAFAQGPAPSPNVVKCDLPDGCEEELAPPVRAPTTDLQYPDDVKKYFEKQQKQSEQQTQEKQGLAPSGVSSETPVAPSPAPVVVPPAPITAPAVETPKPEEKKPELTPTPPPAKPAPNFKSDLPEGWEEAPTLQPGQVPLEEVKTR